MDEAHEEANGDSAVFLASLEAKLSTVGGETYDVAILGQRHDARVLPEAPFDPKGMRLRA